MHGFKNPQARLFYEIKALRGGWTVRQLNCQIESRFYERTALSRDKVAMLERAAAKLPRDQVAHQ